MTNSSTGLRRPLRTRILQNFHLVWLDENIDENNEDHHNSIKQLQQIVSTINTFTDIDECLDFVTDITNDTALMIVSQQFSQDILSVVQDIFQVKSVYIMCKNKTELEQWQKKSSKMHGAYTDIASICKTIRGDSKVCDYNALSISFIKQTDENSVENLNTLDCTFMYTQILKDILLTIDFTQEHIDQFLNYCREQFADSTTNLEVIKKIEKEYYDHSSLWWYTSDTFLYGMLNRALRVMDVDMIVKIGFFLRDVHRHITTLHNEQFGEPDVWDPFIVYRGQSLSASDFDKLKSAQGGLLSFNNFLSTSCSRDVGKLYVESNLNDPNMMGVLFVITVDPSISVTSFASIASDSYYSDEGEILFSMHSIFRIGEMKQSEDNERLWQVDLTLTNDNDSQLIAVMKFMQEETSSNYVGWYRLGKLLKKLGQYDKAQELYETLLEQVNNQEEEAYLYDLLGAVYNDQLNSPKAIRCYEQSLATKKKIVTPRRRIFITTGIAVAKACTNMGKYSEALELYEKCRPISEKRLPANHPILVTLYNGLGELYVKMQEYPKALEYMKKVLEIAKKTFPENHPTLAASYCNLALVLEYMDDPSKALEYHEKAIDIQKKILPPNHPDLATPLNRIASRYQDIGEYSKALEYYESALDIWQTTLFKNHPNLAIAYSNIGSVYLQMNENSKALTYFERALEIRQKVFFQSHPDLGMSYNHLAMVYKKMGDYSKAIEYSEKAINVLEKTPRPNNIDLASSYVNLGGVYTKMGEHAKSIEFLDKAAKIFENLPSIHSGLATVYKHLALIYKNMNNHSKATEFCEKTIDILQRSSRPNDSYLANTHSILADVYKNMGEYAKSIEYYHKVIEIFEKNLPSTQSNVAAIYNSLGITYKKMNDYSKALECYEKNLEISQKILPPNDIKLAIFYNKIAQLFKTMSNYEKALEYFQYALEIRQHSLPPDHPKIKSLEKSIENVKKEL